MGTRFFRTLLAKQAATALLCLASTGQVADAVDQDDDLVIVDGRVMASETGYGARRNVGLQNNTIVTVNRNELHMEPLRWAPREGSLQVGTTGAVLEEAEADLTTRLSFHLAVSEMERRSESWSPVDVARETTSLELKEPETFGFSLAAFEEDRPDATAEEADRRNRIALLLGATTTTDGHTGFTIGLEYEWRLSDLIGVGAVAEATPNGREFVGAVPVFFHPVGGLALSIGPGFSIEEGDAHFLVRFGIGWDFELPAGLSLAPAVSYDLTEGTHDAIVYGLMLSYAF